MINYIGIKLIIDEFNTHNDLLLNVPMWNLKTTFDTYYLHFLIFDPAKNTDSNIIRLRRKVASNYFNFWFNAFKQLKEKKLIILPIGIHDQAINFFIFELTNLSCIDMKYGWIESNKFDFDYLSINEYYNINSYEFNFEYEAKSVSYSSLIKDFEQIIKNFETCQVKESQMREGNYPGITFIYPKEE